MQNIDKCTVLIEAWQMQCCGKPFKVGNSVKWFVSKWEQENPFNEDMGKIDFMYDHHSEDETRIFEIKGMVESIVAVYYDYRRESENSNLMLPVSESTIKINEADGWNNDFEGKELDSYFVRLKNVIQYPQK
ncbi:MAG: hypothetical protein FWC41_03595 [Firmicutes bacterium]|nr:hypothetical protein [Bacillota bacterium]